jgi:hypothetical protein
MSNYFNDAGEPLMDGASMRYEMYLDSQDDYYDEPDYYLNNDVERDCHGDPDECPYGGCGDCDDVEADPMEDQWLDGSYEE